MATVLNDKQAKGLLKLILEKDKAKKDPKDESVIVDQPTKPV